MIQRAVHFMTVLQSTQGFVSNDEPLIGVDVHLLLKHSGIPFSPEDIRETPKIQR